MLIEGVEIVTQRAAEEDGFLGNDTELGAQVLEPDLACVHTVNLYSPVAALVDAEQRQERRRLAGPRSPAYANLLKYKDGAGGARHMPIYQV